MVSLDYCLFFLIFIRLTSKNAPKLSITNSLWGESSSDWTWMLPKHSGPTEKVQALHRSLNMADAAISKRFLWSIVRFCGVKFTLEADILQVRMFTMVRCHLSVILFIPFFQLSPRLFEQRARYWPFRNINREWCYSPTRESTSRKSTVLTTSGTVPANICAFLYAFFCVIFKSDGIYPLSCNIQNEPNTADSKDVFCHNFVKVSVVMYCNIIENYLIWLYFFTNSVCKYKMYCNIMKNYFIWLYVFFYKQIPI